MKWTTEQPTAPGWYFRQEHEQRCVVKVRKSSDGRGGFELVVEYPGRDGVPTLTSRKGGLWAGPIPMPEEPDHPAG